MEVLRVSLFLKQQLTVTILDMSMACAISKSWKNAPQHPLPAPPGRSDFRPRPQIQIPATSTAPSCDGTSPGS